MGAFGISEGDLRGRFETLHGASPGNGLPATGLVAAPAGLDEPQPDALSWRWRLSASEPIAIEAAVDVAAAVMAALNQTARRLFGSNRLPPDLHLMGEAARGRDGRERHSHAFVLPEDLDLDGALDHVCVALCARLGAAGFTRRGLSILSACPGFWLGRIEASLAPIALGSACPLGLDGPARAWASMTPFAIPLLRGPAERQLVASLARMGVPEPVRVARLAGEIAPAGRRVAAPAFRPEGPGRRRWDQKPALEARRGEMAFWRIEFAAPVAGPMALGGLSHYGLGRFAPAPD